MDVHTGRLIECIEDVLSETDEELLNIKIGDSSSQQVAEGLVVLVSVLVWVIFSWLPQQWLANTFTINLKATKTITRTTKPRKTKRAGKQW